MEDYRKKKKKKLKKLSNIWRPVPPEKQMYPHTHYDKELNLQWVFEVMGILQSWDKTLTHLLLKLADLHNEDILKIIEELKKLLTMIQSWINALQTALNNYAQAENKYQQQAIIEAQALVLLTQTINTGITDVTPVLQAVLECIENMLKKHDSYFEEIMENITNIYADLQAIHDELDKINDYIDEIFDILQKLISNSTSTKRLTYGTDYNITFYNGFGPWESRGYTIETAPRITRSTTTLSAPQKTYVTDEISIISSTTCSVSNSNTVHPGVVSAPRFAHGSGYSAIPESRILKLTLLLDDLKNRTASGTTSVSEIFNCRPLSARASWQTGTGLDNDSAGNLMLYLGTISDGYNRQYYESYDSDLTFNLCNFRATATYTYSK